MEDPVFPVPLYPGPCVIIFSVLLYSLCLNNSCVTRFYCLAHKLCYVNWLFLDVDNVYFKFCTVAKSVWIMVIFYLLYYFAFENRHRTPRILCICLDTTCNFRNKTNSFDLITLLMNVNVTDEMWTIYKYSKFKILWIVWQLTPLQVKKYTLLLMGCNLSLFSGKTLQHKTHAKKLPGRFRRQTQTLNTQQRTVSQYHM